MPTENLIRIAESCSVVRRAIGHLLLTPAGSLDRDAAQELYRKAMRELLLRVRDEECALFLEAAGELAD